MKSSKFLMMEKRSIKKYDRSSRWCYLPDSIKISVDENKLKLTIGKINIVWNSHRMMGDLHPPMKTPDDFDNNSVYGLYLQEKNYISFKDYIKSAEKLELVCNRIQTMRRQSLTWLTCRYAQFKFADAVATAAKAFVH
jgi:hypothetical protein